MEDLRILDCWFLSFGWVKGGRPVSAGVRGLGVAGRSRGASARLNSTSGEAEAGLDIGAPEYLTAKPRNFPELFPATFYLDHWFVSR